MPLPLVVVGGGIAGLAAAYELARLGRDVRVFEASGRLGGLIHTELLDGFTIDAGPDAFLVEKRGARALCEELGLMSRAISPSPPRVAYVLRDCHLHALPEGTVLGIPSGVRALVGTRLLSLRGKLRAACDLFLPAPAGRSAQDQSIGPLLRQRLGREVVDWLVEPILGGIYGGDIDELSADLLPAGVRRALAEHRGVMASVRANRRPRNPNGIFRSFPRGMAEIVDAIAGALPPESVRCDSPVAQILVSPHLAVVLASGETIPAAAVLLATPAYVTAQLLAPIDRVAAARCADIPYVSLASVVLAYRRTSVAHPLAGSGFVVPAAERGCSLIAATWLSSKWPNRAPPGFVLIRAFFGRAHRTDALELNDELLAQRAHGELRRLLGISAPPTLTRVYRWPNASAQHTVGHLARVREIETRLGAHPGIAVIGSGYRAIGIPDCIDDARAVARRVGDQVEG